MDWQDEYERKKITVNQVFEQHLTGNQKIYTGGLHVPTTIISALIDRVATGTLTGIDLYGNWMNGDITFAELDVTPEQFRYHTYFAGPNERTGFANGSKCVAHIPVHFSDTNRMLEEVGLDYAVVQMTPPDAQGNCNIGPLGFEQGALRGAKHIIAQINPRLPRVFGDSHNYHVSTIDAFVMQEELLEDVQVPAPTPEEAKVAEFIVNRVNDGDTIQLGIGGIINAMFCSSATNSGEFQHGANGVSWPVIEENGYTDEDGLKYDVLTFTRIEPLKAGAMTEWNVINYVGIGKNVTSADIQTAVEKGFIKVSEDGTMTVNVLVQADAIQAEGFANATEAFAAFDAQA